MESLQQVDVMEQVKAYLLGRLNEPDERRHAGRLLSDAEFFQAVGEAREAVLDELVDDYLSGELRGQDRSAFEERLLHSSEVRARLSLGHALFAVRQRALQRPLWQERFRRWIQPLLQPSPILAPALSACLVLALAGGVWSMLRVSQLQSQLREATSQQARSTASSPSRLDAAGQPGEFLTQPAGPVATRPVDLRTRPAQAMIASFILKPGLQRGEGEIARVPISPDQLLVELRLDLGLDEYQSYQIALYDSSGDEVLSQSKLQATAAGNGVFIALRIPAQLLHVDDYKVTVSGITAGQPAETIDRYYFRVSRL